MSESRLLRVVGMDPEAPRALQSPVRAGFIIILIAFVGFGGWASFVPLSGAIIAPGLVKVESNRKTVQHLEGGIVASINVRDGDVVKAGQTLIEIQSEQISASVEIIGGQLDAELAKNARLRSERDQRKHIEFPPALTSRSNQSDIAALMESEERFFNAKQASLEAQLKLAARQIEEARQEIRGLEEQVAAEDRSIALYQEEVEANRTLEAKQYVQKPQILALKRGIEEYTARRGSHRADIARAAQRITDFEQRALSLTDHYVQEASAQLTESQVRLFDLEERMRPSRDALQRQRITAPIAGTVVGLKVFTVGGVIRPGDALMDIVPTENKLIFEARLDVKDIDEVHIGSEAEVRLSALDQRTTPLITGKVDYISADRLVDETNHQPYYQLHITADPVSLKRAAGLSVHPGMSAEIFVRTRERTMLRYWLEPLTGVLNRTMRET